MNGNVKVFKIKDSASGTTAEVIPEFGALMTSLCVNGKEIFYTNPDFMGSGNVRAGGFPVLFPICGSLKNKKYSVDAKTYDMPNHGFTRSMQWGVDGEKTTEKSITMVLVSNEETKKYYPFDFVLSLTYALEGGTLIVRQEVQNNSANDMPFYSGYHPFFAATDKKSIVFDIAAEKYINYATGTKGSFDNNVDFDSPVDHVIFNLQSNVQSFINRKDGYSLTYKIDSNIKTLVLWTEQGKDFICLEPWMANPDAMNTGEGLYLVKPGEKAVVEIKVDIDMLD